MYHALSCALLACNEVNRIYATNVHCRRGPVKIIAPVGPEPENVPYVLVFLGRTIIYHMHKLTLSDQAKIPL